MANITRLLPPVERAYAAVRFTIMRPKILSVLDLMLPDRGRILDVGCGFGLFAAYFGQTHPRRAITGIDPAARRVAIAQRMAQRLGLAGHTFREGKVEATDLGGPYAAVYMLDVMHHLPSHEQSPVLERLKTALEPRGLLLIKEITTEPRAGLRFTKLLDQLMVGWDEPLSYRHHDEWAGILVGMGFEVRMVRIPDVLPYPHVVIAARRLD